MMTHICPKCMKPIFRSKDTYSTCLKCGIRYTEYKNEKEQKILNDLRESIACTKAFLGHVTESTDEERKLLFAKARATNFPFPRTVFTIPEILLQHGFVEEEGYYKAGFGFDTFQDGSWFMEYTTPANDTKHIHLPNLTPDNLPTLLHILGITK